MLLQRTLPNPHHLPAIRPEDAGHQPVAILVYRQLAAPERRIGLGLGPVAGTPMPEATVHKDCQPCLQKNEIGFAEHVQMPPPAGDFVPTQ